MTATRSLTSSLQHLGGLLLASDVAGLSDAELVGRFAQRRDEAAFTALVRRYGTVVLGVCRRVLRHEQDAEDAFQATFLVLARNAASVQRAGAVGNWLYGVAYNVARKAKAMRHRRTVKEREAAARQRPEAQAAVLDDLQEILDQELHALPDKYRSAVVLCDLLGLTIREAAGRVGCPQKTLGTRLRRGRSLLAGRLTRRRVAISAAALAVVLSRSATAATPLPLIATTVQAAIGFAAGSTAAVSPAVAALTQGVSSVMLPKTLKSVVLLACAVVALAGLSAGSLSHLSGGRTTPAALAADVSSGPADQAPAKNSLAKLKEAKPVRLFTYLDLLHRYLFNLLHSSGAGSTESEGSDEKKADKDKAALSGAWALKGGEAKIEFSDKDTLKIFPHGDNLVIAILCKYTTDKEGLVKAQVSGFEGKDELKEKVKEHLPVGLEFSFKWKVKDERATLGDVKCDKFDGLKSHLEGEYELKK
jgi:RNA polymerase sigma factor (sigma-70 family)